MSREGDQYGTLAEPGIVSFVDSDLSAGISADSPGNVGLVGEMGEEGEAEPGEVHTVQRRREAEALFGEDSQLTENVVDALQEGASPVWAAGGEGEDLQSLEEPLYEIATGAEVEWIDFLGVLSEDHEVQTEAEVLLEDAAKNYHFTSLFVPASPDDGGNEPYNPDYEVGFDNSRVAALYPYMNNGTYVLGSYLGVRAQQGIRTTPIGDRLITQRDLEKTLTPDERGITIENRVIPLQADPAGVEIIDDKNTAEEDSDTDANIQFAYSRLVVDYIVKTVKITEEPYIGRLHRPEIRSSLKGAVENQLQELKSAAQVVDFETYVEAKDSDTALMNIHLNLAEPLRFVENEITIGGD